MRMFIPMLQEVAKQLLSQIEDVVEQCRQEDYIKPLAELGGATIGQHTRHTLEFFLCLSQGVDQRYIDYDKRKHDATMETNREVTVRVIRELRVFLEEDLSDAPLVLAANYGMHPESECTLITSFFRELAYTVEHAIHHMALMAVGVRVSFSYIKLPQGFGVAASTLRYRHQGVEN